MATSENYRNLVRMERFTRLVAAYNAAVRWELHNSAWLFWNKLLRLGAYIDNEGQWHIDELPAAGRGKPY